MSEGLILLQIKVTKWGPSHEPRGYRVYRACGRPFREGFYASNHRTLHHVAKALIHETYVSRMQRQIGSSRTICGISESERSWCSCKRVPIRSEPDEAVLRMVEILLTKSSTFRNGCHCISCRGELFRSLFHCENARLRFEILEWFEGARIKNLLQAGNGWSMSPRKDANLRLHPRVPWVKVWILYITFV